MRTAGFSHVIGFDDFPFGRGHRGNVRIVGVVYAGLRLEGVLSGQIRRDGRNSTQVLSNIPEPLRAAHLIASGIATGQSRARP